MVLCIHAVDAPPLVCLLFVEPPTTRLHALREPCFIIHESWCLQDPAAFIDRVKTCVRPTGGRQLEVWHLDSILDWHEFFASIGDTTGIVQGHTQTKAKTAANEEAIHVWRFCRRRHLAESLKVLLRACQCS